MGGTRLNLAALNSLSAPAAEEKLLRCCHSARWAGLVAAERPFASGEELTKFAERTWFSLTEEDWVEAFAAHPEIGNTETLKEKFRNTKSLASAEQAKVAEADEATLAGLLRGNKEYKAKFGFIFIVFATGKGAREMLTLLEARLGNTREAELTNAAREQWKITQLRMEKIA